MSTQPFGFFWLLRFAALACILWANDPSLAQVGASGDFTGKDVTLVARDAYAFHGKSTYDGHDILVVAVSDAGFVAPEVDVYWDRRRALQTYFEDDSTLVVYFELDLSGSYEAFSYYWGPGYGCGYCRSSEVKSTIKRKGDRLSGALSNKDQDADVEFQVTIDVAISSDDHGVPQGSGGGQPGRAYLGYHRALTQDDRDAILEHLCDERRQVWRDAKRNGDLDGFIQFLSLSHPESIRVTESYVQEGNALLVLEGQGKHGSIVGEAMMVREKGGWLFVEETLDLAP